MNATIKDGKLIVEIDMQKPTLSKTGKTYIVASSGGFRATAATVDGKPISVNLTATVK